MKDGRETYFRYAGALYRIKKGRKMATPIELGLVLEGEDARRFQDYLDHPTDTDDGRELIREAALLAQKMRL